MKRGWGAFALVLVAGIGSGLVGGLMFRGQEIANLESLAILKAGELGYLRDLERRVGDVERRLSADH